MKKLTSLAVLSLSLSLGGAVAAQPAPGAPVQALALVPVAAPYGTAGCGLGSLIFGNQRGFMQVFAATTNGTFGSQTFGISSGTSNCVDAGNAAIATSTFVETNRPVLAKDIARGSGETIATLSTLAGCARPDAVGRSLQGRFDEIFPDAAVSDRQVSGRVVSLLRSDASLQCSKLN